MKCSLGRKPLEVTFAFILVVTLLLPGVTSRSIASTATTSPNVSSGPKIGDLEEEPVLDEFELEPYSEKENLTESDSTLEDHDIEAVRYINGTAATDLEEPTAVSDGTGTNNEDDEDEALALFSLLVRRAVDEDDAELMNDSKEDESEMKSVDEDKFSISDLPRLLKPLIDAFSDKSSSEAPQKDDFLSWFPSLKDLFEPSKPSGSEATNSAARSGRRSSFPVVSQPSLQAPTVSAAQPSEPEILPSSQPDYRITVLPNRTRPPITIPKFPITTSPPNHSDSDEDSETDF